MAKKSIVLRVSLRSESHATDSTRSGCTANSKATTRRDTTGRCADAAQESEEQQRPRSRATAATWRGDRPRPATEQIEVEGMREPGQRMPVVGVARREGPAHRVGGQSALHRRVLHHVAWIVEGDPAVAEGRPKGGEAGDGDQGGRQSEFANYRESKSSTGCPPTVADGASFEPLKRLLVVAAALLPRFCAFLLLAAHDSWVSKLPSGRAPDSRASWRHSPPSDVSRSGRSTRQYFEQTRKRGPCRPPSSDRYASGQKRIDASRRSLRGLLERTPRAQRETGPISRCRRVPARW